MRIRSIQLFGLIVFSGVFTFVSAQTAAKPSVVTGDVVSISESKIVLKTKDGDLDVMLSDKTDYKRVPPENPALKAAVATTLSDIGEGDKLLVTGIFPDDKKTLPARSIYLMSKSDIAEKQKKEAQEWATRGISGRVSAVNTPANQVTIDVRGLLNSTSVTVSAKPDAAFKRYAPNSVKYSEALESSIAEIKPGDMFRALGDRNAEGTTFTAEVIVTGAFQTVAGTIKSIDAQKNEVLVMDTVSKKDVTIALGASSVLKRFPEEMAQRILQFGGSGASPGGGAVTIRPAGGSPSGQGNPAAGGPGRGGFGGGARGGIDDLFERFPVIAITDLKPGDIIAVSSSKNGDPQHITAIKLLAGVEPFLRVAQAGGQAGRGGRGGGQGSFTIPGLDGFDFP